MLIQEIAGASRLQFIDRSFGFGPAEPRPIGLRLLFGLTPFDTLLESLEIDYVSHASPIKQPCQPSRPCFD